MHVCEWSAGVEDSPSHPMEHVGAQLAQQAMVTDRLAKLVLPLQHRYRAQAAREMGATVDEGVTPQAN